MSRRPLPLPLVAAVLLVAVSACGDEPAPATTSIPEATSTTAAPTPTTAAPVEAPDITVLPEFIQGVIPGERLLLLVSLVDPGAGPATISADAPGASVSVAPGSISGTDVAEVTIVPGPAGAEGGQFEVTVTAQNAAGTKSVTKSTEVMPWPDDRGDQAREILELFTPWLADNRPDLEITPEVEFTGTYVAPMLLVVSHYAFFSEAWEIGVSWHIMLPPDDFAEAYLRPRGELRPTLAFRVASWQTALETGTAEITEVDPPADVVR